MDNPPPPPGAEDRSAVIARLNDALRRSITRPGHNQIVMTSSVSVMLGERGTPEALRRLGGLISAVRDFDAFGKDNDPHGERDFGRFTVFGEHFLWKIDYYDRGLRFASPDPTDPDRTCRVLTIMLASDY
jgi:hypothetical protein